MNNSFKKQANYEQLYVHIFHNQDETDQFLERYNLSKLTQEEIDNLGLLPSEDW